MPSTDPIPHQEIEQSHEQDFSALKEVSHTIDEILADDTAGKGASTNYDPYGEKPSLKVGDRYSEAIDRVITPEGAIYSAAYTEKIVPPHPIDDGKAPYSPYDFKYTEYKWGVSLDGSIESPTKNGAPLDTELVQEAQADIQKLISDGREKGTLVANSREELAADSQAEAIPPKRESTLRKLASRIMPR